MKTVPGFNGGGATVEDVKLLRSVAGSDFRVKVAGGIKTYQNAIYIIEAGANRIGTSGAIEIISGVTSQSAY